MTDRFERASKNHREVLESLRESGLDIDSALDDIKPNLENLPTKYSARVVEPCIEKFVDAELDFHSPGNRGIGRISEAIPRYGAYFKRFLQPLEQDSLARVRMLIEDQVLVGYLSHCYWCEEPLGEPTITDGETLFRAWIPVVYSSAARGAMNEDFAQLFSLISTPPYEAHKAYITGLGFKGGGLLSKDKTDMILFHYPLAGVLLRRVELEGR